MDKQLLERRTKMLQQHLMGIPLKLIVENLEKESGATAKNLYHDWERRRQWIPQVVQLDDPTLLHSFLEGARSVLPKAWLLLQDTDNDFVKLGALKLIKDTNLEVLEILQSVGAVEKKPQQVNLLSLNLGFEADPDLKRILMEEAERQKRERETDEARQPGQTATPAS
jgi:hypothetical protein